MVRERRSWRVRRHAVCFLHVSPSHTLSCPLMPSFKQQWGVLLPCVHPSCQQEGASMCTHTQLSIPSSIILTWCGPSWLS